VSAGRHWVGLVTLVQMVGMAGACLAAEPAPTFFSIRKHAGYPEPERTLQQLVAEKGTTASNHFCVLGYRTANGDQYAWVHWKEGRALVLWEPVVDANHPATLTSSRRFLRLDQDVVASEGDIKGSTYLVTRAWASQVQSDCIRHGDKFLVTRKKAN
jgi:hypothetical protein